ncbi:MAG: hypothetical protein V7707_15200 [Motiliproteus sp.]
MRKIVIALLAATLSLGASWTATALADKSHKEEKSKHAKAEKQKGAKTEKQLPKGLEKKLARGGELPPGWEKKLQKGEVLSPELRASSEPVSKEIAEAIEANEQIAAGDQIAADVIRIQDKVIRVSKGQGTVLDVIDLADLLTGRGMREQ